MSAQMIMFGIGCAFVGASAGAHAVSDCMPDAGYVMLIAGAILIYCAV